MPCVWGGGGLVLGQQLCIAVPVDALGHHGKEIVTREFRQAEYRFGLHAKRLAVAMPGWDLISVALSQQTQLAKHRGPVPVADLLDDLLVREPQDFASI